MKSEQLEQRSLLSANSMFTQLQENAVNVIGAGNSAVADALATGMAGTKATFSNLFSESQDQLFELPTFLQVQTNGQNVVFDPLDSAEIRDDLYGLDSGMQNTVVATAPVATPIAAFGPGNIDPFMGGFTSPTYAVIYGEQGTAWYDSNTNTGGANSYITLISSSTPEVTSELFLAHASFSTGNGQGSHFHLNGTYSKAFTNGDSDNWTANLTKQTGALEGSFTVNSKRGPLSVAGHVMFWNSVVSTVNVDINYSVPNEQFSFHYQSSPSHTIRTASYRNTVYENMTLMADYGYDSSLGTRTAAGIGYWIDEKSYFESIFGRVTPVNGPAHSAALITGVRRTNIPDMSLSFAVSLTDDVVNEGAAVNLVPYLSAPINTKWMLRGMTILDYDNIRDSVFGFGLDYSP